MAPACGGLKPESAIATQALLTKLDRIIIFLLARPCAAPRIIAQTNGKAKTETRARAPELAIPAHAGLTRRFAQRAARALGSWVVHEIVVAGSPSPLRRGAGTAQGRWGARNASTEKQSAPSSPARPPPFPVQPARIFAS